MSGVEEKPIEVESSPEPESKDSVDDDVEEASNEDTVPEADGGEMVIDENAGKNDEDDNTAGDAHAGEKVEKEKEADANDDEEDEGDGDKDDNDEDNTGEDGNAKVDDDAADANGKDEEDDNDDGDDKDNDIAGCDILPNALEHKIIKQLEYYFGDINLRRDKFLLNEMSKSEEGWVNLSVLLTFKRLAALSTDNDVIINAILKSDEGLIEVHDDHTKLRRHPECPIPEYNEEKRKEIMQRTLYMKGFPLNSTMTDLLEFFGEFEKLGNITMRKYLDKPTKTYKFKGSIFITFGDVETAQKVLDLGQITYSGKNLITKWQEKYIEEKKEERIKSKNERESKKAAAAAVAEDKIELPKGAVLHFDNSADFLTRELLRKAIEKIDADLEIAYIEYSQGEKEGYIRFQAAGAALKLLEKLDEKKLKIKDAVLNMRALEGEEEEAFINKAIDEMQARRGIYKTKAANTRKRRGGFSGGQRNKKKTKQ